jgi:signal transduction histidine kinase
MNFRRLKVNWLMLGTVALVSLLVFAALLQFHFINRVTESDRRQQREYLETTLKNFGGDFSEAMLRLLPVFRPSPTIRSDTQIETYLTGRLSQWRDTSDHPQLLGSVSFGEETPNGIVFKRMRDGDNSFTEQTWPESLTLYRTILEKHLRMPGGEPPLFPNGYAFELSEGRPVIVFPLVTNAEPPPPPNDHSPRQPPPSNRRDEALPPERRQRPLTGQEPRALLDTLRPAPPHGIVYVPALKGWCFLELDLGYLQKNLLPELFKRHYGQEARDNYRIAVVAGNPPRIIYQSDQTMTSDSLARIDAGILLFDAKMQQNRPPAPPGQPLPPPPPPPAQSSDERPTESSSNPSHPSPPNQEPQPFIAGTEGATIAQLEAGQNVNDSANAWWVVLKSASGSLDSRVNQARLQNLIVSFGILLLLTVSIVMLVLATRRAREVARQQMEFVAGVSHELRTPLTVIQSTSYNLSQGMIQDPQRVQKYGDVIRDEARRLIKQVEQMLSFAGIQSGRKLYDLRPLDVTEMIDRALAEYTAVLEDGGWRVEKEVDEGLPLILADAQSLESVLKNLIGNALKYAAQGKWLKISARVAQDKKGSEIQITVADHGPGIALADLPHIFEPFYRGREVFGSSNSGAGLGLSLVERHLQAHKGRVTVESSAENGTAFTLHLPALAVVDGAGSNHNGRQNIDN